MPTRLMRNYSIFAAFRMIIAGMFLFILLPASCLHLQPASFVFVSFATEEEGLYGLPSNLQAASRPSCSAWLCEQCILQA